MYFDYIHIHTHIHTHTPPVGRNEVELTGDFLRGKNGEMRGPGSTMQGDKESSQFSLSLTS